MKKKGGGAVHVECGLRGRIIEKRKEHIVWAGVLSGGE